MDIFEELEKQNEIEYAQKKLKKKPRLLNY